MIRYSKDKDALCSLEASLAFALGLSYCSHLDMPILWPQATA